ncbi:hypothetical protein CC117_27420 [Parafrankia colletiae]|uniref:TIR domain-containing protein n=1 Tax=Parafrankia colletiae TaxID=573497 RepID=A0A1S1QB38_9ACTN|nr:TIR domain-containing protein [Parafrankia colletiae]OHV30847.1 hypothetical protein CC117_27420 [Parafrankia colletiae]
MRVSPIGRDDAAAEGGAPVRRVDFFVSYEETDRSWAEWIAWQLESAGHAVVLQAWDFAAGANYVHETHRAAMDAARTVAVLSAAYLTSAYAEVEWQAAWAADPSGVERRLVLARVEDCPRPGLLGQRVGVDLFGLDERAARERLLAAASGERRKPDQPPPFPPRPRAAEEDSPRFPGVSVQESAQMSAQVSAQAGSLWQPGRSPFPGLVAFDASRAAVFEGRDGDTRRLVERLTGPAGEDGLLVVVGPSGCGKSSLVAAGLGPVLAADPDWLVVAPVVPGGRPLAALAAVLAEAGRGQGLDWSAERLAARLGEPDAVVEAAGELVRAAGATRLLLVVDQAEELLARAGPPVRAQFFALLAAASGGGLVRVVATLRSEYLDRLIEQTAPVGLRVRPEALYPLERDLLPLVIAGPARSAGLRIEDELVARMVADTGDGQGLPLLAYTLARLHSQVRLAGTDVLSLALYEATGGVRGALVDHADAALSEARTSTGRGAEQVLADLLHLVSVDGQGEPVRRRVPLDDLPGVVRAGLVPFVTRRLLTVGATDGGPVTVEVAHERLLAVWPPLNAAIRQASDRLRQRAQAESAAAEWDRQGRRARWLWNLSLVNATLTVVGVEGLTSAARAFLLAGRRRGRRRLGGAFAVLIVLSLVATSLGIVALVQGRTAEDRRRVAMVDRLLTLADTSREGDPTAALRFGVAAGVLAPDEGTTARIRGSLLDTLVDLPALPTSLAGREDSGQTAAAGPNGPLVTGDGTERSQDTSDQGQAYQIGDPLTGHVRSVGSAAFGPGGLLATGSDDDTARLWDVSDPLQAHPLGRPLTGHQNGVNAVAFGPDGLLATGGGDGTVRLWDTSDREQAYQIGDPLIGHIRSVGSVAFGPGGLLATGSDDGTVRLWDVSDPLQAHQPGRPLTGHEKSVDAVAFGPDGLLATGGNDGTVRLWDVSDPLQAHQLGQPLTGHESRVFAVAFGPGGLLATGSGDNTAQLWDVSDPLQARQLGQPLTGHENSVVEVAFGPDGLLATGSVDGTVRLWDTSDRENVRRIGQPLASRESPGQAVYAVAFRPDGLLATAGRDSMVRVWDVGRLKWLRAHAFEVACRLAGRGLTEAEWRQFVSGTGTDPYRDSCGDRRPTD